MNTRTLFLYLTLLGLFASPASSAPWQALGPDGGNVTALAPDPHNSDVIYAGTYDSGLFKSTNRGESWSALQIDLPPILFIAPFRMRVLDLAVAPSRPSTIYATFDALPTVYRSTDGGNTWHDPGNSGIHPWILEVRVDPRNENVLYAGVYSVTLPVSGLYKSTDGARTWIRTPLELRIIDLELDPDDPDTLYASSPTMLHKSSDGGNTWRDLPFDATRATLSLVGPPTVIYASELQRLHASDLHRLHTSTDAGNTWSELPSARDHGRIEALAPGILLGNTAGLQGEGILRSTDNGDTWQVVHLVESAGRAVGVTTVAVQPGDPDQVFIGLDGGTAGAVLRSTNGGRRWSPVDRGLQATTARFVAHDPHQPEKVFSIFEDHSPHNPTCTLSRSMDGGVSWTVIEEDVTCDAQLVIHPNQSHHWILAGTELRQTTDGGGSWSLLDPEFVPPSDRSPISTLVMPDQGDEAPLEVYFGYADGLFKYSQSEGRVLPAGLEDEVIFDLAASSDGRVFAASRDEGIYEGTSDGSWRQIFHSGNAPTWPVGVPALAYDGRGSDTLYAATYRRRSERNVGVVRSTDGGETWQAFDNLLDESQVVDLEIDPNLAGGVYAVDYRNGVFRSGDRARSWQPMTEGGISPLVNDLSFSPLPPRRLYATTAGSGLFVNEADILFLREGRYGVEVEWRDFAGNTGRGQPITQTLDTGSFWFFQESNLELMIKILDGGAINGHDWVFFGAISNVEYSIHVTDRQSGQTRTYFNPLGTFASRRDTAAFEINAFEIDALEIDALEIGALEIGASAIAPPQVQAGEELLLGDGERFRVEVEWTDFAGGTGSGKSAPLTSDSGAFWFFHQSNLELLVKVLDGRPVNGHFWVFFGALSNVEYTVTVTDTLTGKVNTYNNPSGTFASVGDTAAF